MSIGAAAGLLAWLVLFPSVITMRYIQATLLLFAMPAAAAAEIATRRSAILALIVPAGILATIVATPRHTALVSATFSSPRAAVAEVLGRPYTCKGSHPFESDCQAHVTINRAARPGDRVLGLSYPRFWLEPHLLRDMSSVHEVGRVLDCPAGPCSPDVFWARVRAADPGFRFILNDAVTHPVPAGAFEAPPPDIEVRALYKMGRISAWEIRRRDGAPAPTAGRWSCSDAVASRSRAASFAGGRPNSRPYSRVNCDVLS